MDDSLFARLGYDPVAIHTRLIGRPPPGGIARLGAPAPPPAGAEDGAASDLPDDGGGPPPAVADPAAAPEREEPAHAASRADRSDDDRETAPSPSADVGDEPPAPDETSPGAAPADADGHALMKAWLNAHWDTVEAMARAGEAPQRPVPPPPADAAPAEPPPRPHIARGDRWTKWKMAQFLRQLAATHSVTAAARAVGMSRPSAYRLRARLKGQPFDIAWEAAFRHGYDDLAQAALELALEGEEVPHYHAGKLVGTHRKRNPQLIVALLRMRNEAGAPMLGRYGAAAEFWSERWDRLLDRIETGSVTWDDERKALTAEELAQLDLPGPERETALLIARNCPDGPRKR